jgi:hypothetical protein
MFLPSYSEDEARAAIAESRSYAEALRRLGMCHTGGARSILKKYAEEVWLIPVDHFDPDAARNEALRRNAFKAVPLEEVLVEGRFYSRATLKERLYAAGLKKPHCEMCGQGELWRGYRISLILDHVNGVRDDNRLENLRIVCPNCAASLDTHCGRNKARLPAQRQCEWCHASFRPKYARHRYCSRACGSRHDNRPQAGVPAPHRRKVTRPSIDQLLADTDELGFLGTGRKYGVSDNAIRKWILWYERELWEWAAALPSAKTADTGLASAR